MENKGLPREGFIHENNSISTKAFVPVLGSVFPSPDRSNQISGGPGTLSGTPMHGKRAIWPWTTETTKSFFSRSNFDRRARLKLVGVDTRCTSAVTFADIFRLGIRAEHWKSPSDRRLPPDTRNLQSRMVKMYKYLFKFWYNMHNFLHSHEKRVQNRKLLSQ